MFSCFSCLSARQLDKNDGNCQKPQLLQHSGNTFSMRDKKAMKLKKKQFKSCQWEKHTINGHQQFTHYNLAVIIDIKNGPRSQSTSKCISDHIWSKDIFWMNEMVTFVTLGQKCLLIEPGQRWFLAVVSSGLVSFPGALGCLKSSHSPASSKESVNVLFIKS